jgi:GH25 family lysozyme M1 (1,4-beta-N-acetylmuramidase)
MSAADPIWGIDVSHWQQSINMKQVKREGYEFAVVKATEGPYQDGSKYTDDRYSQHMKNAQAADLIVGAYHFLVETPAKPQVDHFLSTVGDVRGKIIMVDFEEYSAPHGYLTPGNATLGAFISELRSRIGSHPIVIYSSRGFWNGGDPTGPASQFGDVTTWDAYYLTMDQVDPKTFYSKNKARGWGKPWGSQEPMIWQFTSAGSVAGLNVDVNAFRGTRDELLALAGLGAAAPPSTPTPKTDNLPAWVVEPLAYLEETKGGRYVVWESGRFTNSAPAWVASTPPPPAKVIKDNGAFCAGMPNLAMRKNGVHHVDMSNAWYGGVLWYGNYFVDQMDLAERLKPHGNYPPGTLFIRRYTGPALSQQGHVAIMGRHGKLLQSDVPLGINEERTLAQTQAFLTQGEGGGFQWTVLPEHWLKPSNA